MPIFKNFSIKNTKRYTKNMLNLIKIIKILLSRNKKFSKHYIFLSESLGHLIFCFHHTKYNIKIKSII